MGVSGAIIGGSLLGAAGSIGGAAIGSSAAQGAAQTQASAAEQAAQLQYQEAQQALAAQEAEFQQQQVNMAPWLNTGGSAAMTLGALFGLPSYTTPQVSFPSLTAANPNSIKGGSIGPLQGAPGTTPNATPMAFPTSAFNFTPAAVPPGILSGNASSAAVEGLPTMQTFQQMFRNNPQMATA